MTNNLSYLSNPKLHTLNKWFTDLLGNRYDGNEEIVERIAASLVTNKDLENFTKLLTAVYQLGYQKALQDNQKQLEALGYKVDIKF